MTRPHRTAPHSPHRRRTRLAPAACALALAAVACERSNGGRVPAAAALDPATDPRLAALFAPCARDSHYDVDTSDPIAILEETLLAGQLDPLRRARVELARSGAQGLAVARRILDEYIDRPEAQGWARNALDVVALSEEPEAHELVLRALASPSEELRAVALRMLGRRGTPDAPVPGHGRPEDFDRVLDALARATATTLRECALVLHDLDPARAEALYVEWLERGELPGLGQEFAARFAASTRPETLAWCRARYADAPPFQRPYLAAAAARAGDGGARELLRAWISGDDAERRAGAVAALVAAGSTAELEEAFSALSRCELRLLALREIARDRDSPRVVALLHEACGDACDEVRFLALDELCARRDERAFERALAALDSTNSIELTLTMRALRRTMPEEPALAGRVLDRLLARHARESGLAASERATVLQSIGQVPLARAAEFLLGLARTETGRIQTFEPHRWLCLQAANTGAAGTPLFLAELARERDPRRRIDLLEGLSAPGGDAIRDALLGLVQSDALAPLELVYAADRLVTVGTVATVAPVLKRVTLRVDDPAARRALQCLLWRSYPSRKRG